MTRLEDENKVKKLDSNPDPLTGAPGAHPGGVAAGAATGAATGAVIGAAVGGPLGGMAGGAVGAIAGGLAGKAVAEKIDPTVEHAHWQRTYTSRPYFKSGAPYEHYRPAYQYGWESYRKFGVGGDSFESVEPRLRDDWNQNRGQSALSWDEARGATKDAWDRVRDYEI